MRLKHIAESKPEYKIFTTEIDNINYNFNEITHQFTQSGVIFDRKNISSTMNLKEIKYFGDQDKDGNLFVIDSSEFDKILNEEKDLNIRQGKDLLNHVKNNIKK